MTRFFFIPALAVVSALLLFSPAQAQVPSAEDLTNFATTLTGLENAAEKTSLSDSEIEVATRQGAELRRRSAQCILAIKSEIDRIKTLIGDTPARTNGGSDANATITELETQLATCQDLALRADAAAGKLETLKNQRQAEKFGTRGRNVIDVLGGAFAATANWNAVWRPIAGIFVFDRPPAALDWVLIISMTVLGIGLGLRLRTERFKGSGFAPAVIGAAGLLAGLTFAYAASPPMVIVIGWRLLAIFCLMLLSASLPRPPAEPDRVRTGWRIGGFLFAVLAGHHLGLAFEDALPIAEVEFVRLIVFVGLFATAIPATRHIRFLPLFERAWKAIRALFLIGFTVALVAELAGYRTFAGFVLFGFAGTLAAIILYSLVARGGDAIISTLNSGDTAWSVRVKQTFGFSPHEPVPGLAWLRLFFEILVFAGFALGVTASWGMSEAGRDVLLKYAIDGFELWGVTLVPGRIIGGLLLFSLLLMASRRVRDIAERRWTVELNIEPGGREALVTLIGYAGIILAVLAGLSWAGFSFDKLALVAGALSVGIGFGLQNVVSNFVSGLILLFEQPIRTGDWISVGTTEGIVKKIRVRATEIQKFDRTEVIVPNADFITSSVTNYTLRNSVGRIFLPIGVAYGSDTGLVRELLTDILRNHPQILTGSGLAPDPSVYFTAFGDSSLTFEIRAYVGDVGKRLSVTSDLHFAIDKAFREHGIEIPFPQSDVHVRDWPAITRSDKE
ncbi:Potassium efflux system KefA protein / Small-conductance mechanosensitive channel [hydrothermal vent metagenome]|uniref:Potassium efflux system KefA protein / Small-conductance mechanosensitive channel n=1 Tax=hydrothermal vent metagenome TaxID=652676 RepID=A0A3B0TR56_9ZZZZ